MPAGTILIVDDDPICAAVTSLTLRQAGFITRTATDGVEALQILQSVRPDLIISDIQMPNMDGFELARKTREIARLSGVPMVAVSAMGASDTERRAYDAGFSAYLAKPVVSAGLVAMVLNYLEPLARSNSSTAA